jgi:hypothetical protein
MYFHSPANTFSSNSLMLKRVFNYAMCAEAIIVGMLFVILILCIVMAYLQPIHDWIGLIKTIVGFLIGLICKLPLPMNRVPLTRTIRDSVTTVEDTGVITTRANSIELSRGDTNG